MTSVTGFVAFTNISDNRIWNTFIRVLWDCGFKGHVNLQFICLTLLFSIFTCFQRVEQQEKDDQELCVKPKGGRSQQQKKKPAKPVKKAEDKPKTQTKKPALDAEGKQKKADGKSKGAAAKIAERNDDLWEFEGEEDAAPPVKSLADRLAQRQKVLSSSSSSSSSGTESTSRSAARSKKQTTLEMFSTKKKAADKAKKADSDDDFIMQFSDEEDGPPPVKRTARSTAPKVCAAF